MSLTNETKALAILAWIAEGKTGVSSNTLALASVGLERKGPFGSGPPRDASDCDRCEMLAKMCPFVVEALPGLIEREPMWARWADRIVEAAGGA